MNTPRLSWLAEDAVIIHIGDTINDDNHHQVQALAKYLEQHPLPGMIELVPALTTITIYFHLEQLLSHLGNSDRTSFDVLSSLIEQAAKECQGTMDESPLTVEIPVCYGGEFGPDLSFVAVFHALTPTEVIQIHAEGFYRAYMIGFAPGFPYLGGLSERIATPRRETPRQNVPAGSVGIAGKQTGVYPLDLPGGWQIIGRTPLPLFRPEQWPPSTIQMGNMIKFKPITPDEYWQLERGCHA